MRNANPTTCRRGNGYVGFTLVELLVVIGIIALLIGTLLPMLGKAQQSANQAKCSSNLHQLALAAIIYATENHDMLLNYTGEAGPGPSDTILGYTGPSYVAWDYERIVSGGVSYYNVKGGVFGKYFTNGKTTSCPQVDPNIFFSLSPGQPVTTLGMSTRLPSKLAMATSSSDTVAFADVVDYGLTSGLFTTTDGISPPSLAFGVDTFQGRHSGKGNVAFLDGHVEGVLVQTRPQGSILPTPSAANYARILNLHLGPCCPSKINITLYSTQSTYQAACQSTFDFYFWVNKLAKSFQ